MGWFKDAFAVDKPGPAEPTPLQQPAADWVCVQIAKRRLSTPSLIFLEMSRPLNFLGAQTMHFFRPGFWALASQTSYEGYVAFSEFLEHRGSIEYLSRRVEHFESQFTRLEKEGKPIGEFIKSHFDELALKADIYRKAQEAEQSENQQND